MTIVFDFQGNLPEGQLSAGDLLLECYRKALGHDLPNRLGAALGMTNLVLEDPAHPLQPESQQLLERISCGLLLAGELVRALADLGDLLHNPGFPVLVDWAEAVREAIAEVRHLNPDQEIEYQITNQLPIIHAPLLPISRSLSLLFQWMCERTAPALPCRVEVLPVSSPTGTGIQIVMPKVSCSLREFQTLFEPFPVVRETNSFRQGLGLVPVCLFLSAWGGRLSANSSSLGTQFTLELLSS